MLTTLLPPTDGTARVAGPRHPARGRRRCARRSAPRCRRPRSTRCSPARDHMRLQTTLQGVPKAERRARGDELLERVGLTDAADRKVGGYSGGMKRRLDLALALVHSPARAVPRRADDRASIPSVARRPVGRGRAAGARGRRDRLPHHAVPRGGRRARRPRRDHRRRAHRRRGHAGGAEGRDRAPVGGGHAGRARRARRGRRGADALRLGRARRRRAPPRCGWRAARTSWRSCARSTPPTCASPTCSSTSRRSTTSSWPRPAASSDAERRRRSRWSPLMSSLQQTYEMARRSVLQTLRQPAMVIPPILFPLILMGINVGGLDAATNIPGFPTDSYLDFAIAFPFVQGSLFASINAGSAVARDVETGFLNRLALTPMQRAAMLLGQPHGRDGGGARSSSLIYLAVGFAAGPALRVRASLGVLVLLVLALLIALAFASLGAFIGLRTGSGEAVQGVFPLFFVFLFLSSSSLPRELIEQDWFRIDRDLQPGLLPVRGPAVADHLRLAGARSWRSGFGFAAAIAVIGVVGSASRPADTAGADMRRFVRRRGRRRLPLGQEDRHQPAAAAAVADLPAVLLRRLRGRAVERRRRAGLRLPVGLHGVPVRVRAAAGVGVRRRVHRVRDRVGLRERLLAAADAGGAEPARHPRRLRARGAGAGGRRSACCCSSSRSRAGCRSTATASTCSA